ncbi:hypothetical protein DSM106972_078090 [Dulcicalothrix desertica PCC 7102]|uniref:Sulfatase-modifying factor enzyme-like domain-containing protein n=1 Tax=Dulcicalothrix desertica PCC 7102 TaxID=232991 RepID=A0A3S1CAL9_9CYAN|nr:formylglycine-generating enzyme family protein [Dulcicalothrix desertica]RUS99367.1 hypothetical protein DSM106972_078090 [Dulcicalothrix desertica PCC 7102]
MVKIPGGVFMMGSPENEGENSERPQHQVTVPAFFMAKFPITQEQYQAVMGSNPSCFIGAKRPVESVIWNNAVNFCTKISRISGKSYRLPTEAEWEYACRAGTITPFNFGKTITTDLVNYDGNYVYASIFKGRYRQQTTDVGSFPANDFGLYDMHGNVWEWCQDKRHDNYDGVPTDGSAWLDSNASYANEYSQILRGGSWNNNPGLCRSAYRNWNHPGNDLSTLGFRVVCNI